MKPIIIDIKDLSDSTEVYESKPNRFIIYTIYLILIIFIVALLWMSLAKIEVVVKSNGIFKGSEAIYEISSEVSGIVKESNVTNGQFVNEGDTLYVLNIEELSDTIIRYQNELKEAQDRVTILHAYEKSLDGDKAELKACENNQYYDEFANREELLYANIVLNNSSTNGQATLYHGTVDSISNAIGKYEEKIDKLAAVKQCIISQNNTFSSEDAVYYSMVSSYLVSYS